MLRGALVVAMLTTVAAPVVATSASAAVPTTATTLLSPAPGEEVGGNPTFTWAPVAGAVRYRVQVSTTDAFTSFVYDQHTYNLNATPSTALPVGTLHWRVAATDGSTGVGPYTSSSFLRTWADSPAPTGPDDGETLTFPSEPLLFTWNPMTGAQKYNIQIDDDVDFVNAQVVATTANPAFTLTNPQSSDKQFFWRVQGVTDNVLSPWSPTRTYYVEWPSVPTLLSPAPGDDVTDVVLEWSPVNGAATYQVQVSPNEDFSNNLSVDVVTKSTRYAPNDLKFLDNGSYYWRVRARDAAPVPNLGNWSQTVEVGAGAERAYFNRMWHQRPTLDAPAPGAEVATPTFRWSPVPHASHYELQVSSDATFSPGTTATCVTNQTSFTAYGVFESDVQAVAPPTTCQIGQGYPSIGQVVYWRVRGMDNANQKTVEGNWSDERTFVFRPTAMPMPVAPAYAATVSVPTLRWTPVVGVSRYRVTILAADTGVQVGQPVTTFATSFTPTNLTKDKAYRWYVQTVDDLNRPGPMPLPQNYELFTYAPEAPTFGFVSVVSPAPFASSPLMPEMSWEPVVGAKSYTIYIRTAGFQLFETFMTTSLSSYTLPDLPPNAGTYEWFVNAVDMNGNVIDDSPIQTFTLENLPLTTGLSPHNCTQDAPCLSIGETPTFSWDATSHTGSYLVYLANDPIFSNKVRTYQTMYTTLTPRESIKDSAANKAYYWFVRPCRTGSARCGVFNNDTFGNAAAFRKSSLPVQLVSPANGATVSTVEETGALAPVSFTWSEYLGTTSSNVPSFSQGARRYRVDVSTTQDFGTLVDSVLVDQTTYTPWEKTYPVGSIFWRVTAIDGSNNVLTASETRMFTRAKPALQTVYPAPGDVVGGTPHFEWTAQPHVKNYELQVAPNGDVNFSTTVSLGISASTPPRLPAYAPSVSLPAGDYAWRVRTIDVDSLPGPWTVGGVFTVTPEVPTLLAPATDAIVTSGDLVFSWSPVTRAAKYKLEASYSAGFGTLIESTATTVMTKWAPIAKVLDGTVHWRVKALDSAGKDISVSAARSFVKDATGPVVKTKTPISGVPVTGAVFTVGFSEPVKGLSATTFTLKSATTGAAVQATVSPAVTTATSTATLRPVAALVPGESYVAAVTSGVTDLNGNPLTAFSWTARTELAIDGVSPVVRKYWDRDTSTGASGGGYLTSRTPGAKLSYTFSGTSASIVGRRAPDGGYAEVWLDGVKQGLVTFYSSTAKWKQVVWSKSGLVNKAHTVELRVLGTKPSASKAPWVFPDAFRYGSFTVEETSPLVVQSFRSVGLTGAFGRSYLMEAHTALGDTNAQPYVLMTFKGTGVSWKGIRGTSGGIAKVYVDGALKSTVDTYGTASTSGQTLWSIAGLPNKTHTVKIVVTGTKRSVSKGYNVTFDSFGVL